MSTITATIKVVIKEIRPHMWPSGIALYRRPLTHTKVRLDEREQQVRFASAFLITQAGDYIAEVAAHRNGKFAIASVSDKSTNPAYAGGIRMQHPGLIPTPNQLAKFGYTKSWLEEEIGANDHRRALPRHITFGFKQPDLWWKDEEGDIVTRLPILGCPVHLKGIKSIEQWEDNADRLTVVLLGDRPHALAFLPGSTNNGASRITRVQEDDGGVSHLAIVDQSTLADMAEDEVDELREELAALEYLEDEERALQVGSKIQQLTFGQPLSVPGNIVSRTPSAAALNRVRRSNKPRTPKPRATEPVLSPAPSVQVNPPDPSKGHVRTSLGDIERMKKDELDKSKPESPTIPVVQLSEIKGIKRYAAKLIKAGLKDNANALRRKNPTWVAETLEIPKEKAALICSLAGQAVGEAKLKAGLNGDEPTTGNDPADD